MADDELRGLAGSRHGIPTSGNDPACHLWGPASPGRIGGLVNGEPGRKLVPPFMLVS